MSLEAITIVIVIISIELILSCVLWTSIICFLNSKPPGRKNCFDLVCIDNSVIVLLFIIVNNGGVGVAIASPNSLNEKVQFWIILVHNGLLYLSITLTTSTLVVRYAYIFHNETINDISDVVICRISRHFSIFIAYLAFTVDFVGPIKTKTFFATLMGGSFDMKG